MANWGFGGGGGLNIFFGGRNVHQVSDCQQSEALLAILDPLGR